MCAFDLLYLNLFRLYLFFKNIKKMQDIKKFVEKNKNKGTSHILFLFTTLN